MGAAGREVPRSGNLGSTRCLDLGRWAARCLDLGRCGYEMPRFGKVALRDV